MSDAKNTPETIADICREMRSKIDCLATDPGYNCIHCVSAAEWARRIEAAHEYALCEKYAGVVDEREREIIRLREERDRLRAALKPVLEINLAGLANYGIDYKSLLAAIVADARNIYKEGANND